MRRQKAAFTLIELLVVIAIIALLIAMLMPVLGKAKESARFAICIKQIHDFSLASHTYQNDYTYMVHPNWGERSGGWLYADSSNGGRSYNSPGSKSNYEQRRDMRETGKMWEYVNREGAIYHCPADEGPLNDTSKPVRAMTSYQFNGALNGYGRLGPDTYSLEQFDSDSIFMWETDETSPRYGFWNDGGNRPDEGLSRRHLDGAPFGVMDGSSVKITQDDFYDIALRQRRPNRLWCNP